MELDLCRKKIETWLTDLKNANGLLKSELDLLKKLSKKIKFLKK